MKRAAARCGWPLLFLCFLFFAGCDQKESALSPEFVPVLFESLPGFAEDDLARAIPALRQSCRVLKEKEIWQPSCFALDRVKDEKSLRAWLQEFFTPYAVRTEKKGFFTGYYEATLRGSRQKKGKYQTPLWERPEDLVTVDLSLFEKEKTGQILVGKLKDGRLLPYDTRQEIEAGSLVRRARPLLWLEHPVDAFFLEAQGSGRILLPEGKAIHVGYAARNGRPYKHIGPDLLGKGKIKRPASAQDIKAWLKQNPAQAQKIMNQNPAFVFFEIRKEKAPLGSLGVELTPERSLAVDPAFVPLGAPLWLATDRRRQLVVAQDAGGAIRGPLRGDLFWGAGEQAEREASQMQERGEFFLLWPKGAKQP